jgi:hypothetical protein
MPTTESFTGIEDELDELRKEHLSENNEVAGRCWFCGCDNNDCECSVDDGEGP